MSVWWASLTGLERCFAYVAVPATLLLILQTLLLLFGLGHDGDADVDGGGDCDGGWDMDPHGAADGPVGVEGLEAEAHDGLFSGLKLLTMRGIVAFLAVSGWGGLWLLRMGMHPLGAVFLAVAMGIWAMLLMALFLRVALNLQSDGTLDMRNTLGRSGTVYLTIPANRSGPGKVTLLVQETLTELEAVTDEEQPIPTGTEIVVVALSGRTTLVVCRK